MEEGEGEIAFAPLIAAVLGHGSAGFLSHLLGGEAGDVTHIPNTMGDFQ